MRGNSFQFTPPHEGRRQPVAPLARREGFNSRPRTRGDLPNRVTPSQAAVSIHAPARGATCRSGGPTSRWPVSIHAPARGATPLPNAPCGSRGFNSRPRTRGDPIIRRPAHYPIVSIHAPARGATPHVHRAPARRPVSIHAPARGATKAVAGEFPVLLFQFTPPHEGRPPPRARSCRSPVSIHAPARGATARPRVEGPVEAVSIHAPARGATGGTGSVSIGVQFQFTPPHEGRRAQLRRREERGGVSIHAPARGATPADRGTARLSGSFNSRPRTRGDQALRNGLPAQTVFQFTPPHEGRPNVAQASRDSRSVSIHAPARGATAPFASSATSRGGFNSRPRTRGDRSWRVSRRARSCFNSRPRTRGDPMGALPPSRAIGVSIHAPARGATRQRSSCRTSRRFQFTPPHEGRPEAYPFSR